MMIPLIGKAKARMDGLHAELARLRERLERLEKYEANRDAVMADLRQDITRLERTIGNVAYRVTKTNRRINKTKGVKHERFY